MRRLALNSSHVEIMRAHLEACLPQEGCGLLAGKDGAVHKVLAVGNQAQSPVRFQMEPLAQLKAFDWIDAHGLELVGIFHSHPAGPERPSATDIAEAAYPVVHLIWSRAEANWRVKGYWIEGGRVSEVGLEMADDEQARQI